MALCTHNPRATVGEARDRRIAAICSGAVSSSFSKRSCLRGIRWRVTDEATGHSPLASAHTDANIYTTKVQTNKQTTHVPCRHAPKVDNSQGRTPDIINLQLLGQHTYIHLPIRVHTHIPFNGSFEFLKQYHSNKFNRVVEARAQGTTWKAGCSCGVSK